MNQTLQIQQTNEETLEIPAFLDKRKGAAMTHAEHSVPKDTPELHGTTAIPAHKTRKVTELPTTIFYDGEQVQFQDMSLTELVDRKYEWQNKLEGVHLLELELRAINQEIRRKAK